ncbi:hypothetical protein [Calothrix rhizosoleniae]|uniref:hypothetical protein n=1 Tax=Calothrix rhizosoleniae TaxID=888997 RepID=UPI000B49B000|nr:hypothetical protein [Calothrix rhizosoleniae]
MNQVGQREHSTQNLFLQLFQQQLQYNYLGNWQDRSNSNIEIEILTTFLIPHLPNPNLCNP